MLLPNGRTDLKKKKKRGENEFLSLVLSRTEEKVFLRAQSSRATWVIFTF